MVERIVDWQKAINLAAKRFSDIVTACNQADSEALKALVISGLGTEEDYTSSPENILKLDEKGYFIYRGFVCQIYRCTEYHNPDDDHGGFFFICRVAIHTAADEPPYWDIIPYALHSIPSDCFMDKCTGLLSAINEAIVNKIPALYDEVKTSAMV